MNDYLYTYQCSYCREIEQIPGPYRPEPKPASGKCQSGPNKGYNHDWRKLNHEKVK